MSRPPQPPPARPEPPVGSSGVVMYPGGDPLPVWAVVAVGPMPKKIRDRMRAVAVGRGLHAATPEPADAGR